MVVVGNIVQRSEAIHHKRGNSYVKFSSVFRNLWSKPHQGNFSVQGIIKTNEEFLSK